MIRRLILLAAAICSPLVTFAVPAAATSPDALVKGVTDEVLAILREDRGLEEGGHRKAIWIIEQKVAPHFDFPRMTRLAVGRAWRDADQTQREALTQEFRTLLVRTYANALTAYRDQTVSFDRPAGERQTDEVTVSSKIRQPGAPPVALDYQLAKDENGKWKVYDVAIEHVSLVTSYRGSFAAELAKGGPAALIESLERHNRRLAGEAAGS